MWALQDIGLTLYIQCATISNNYPNFSSLYCYFFRLNLFSRITSPCISIIIISHPFFMKTRRFYQSNDISLRLCLCTTLKKGYISYHCFCNYSNTHLNAIFYWKLAQLLLGVIIFQKLKNPLWGIFLYFDTLIPTPNEQTFLLFLIFPPYIFLDLSLFTFSFIFLFLFGCCHFWKHNEGRVQCIYGRWVLQDIGLIVYIHCVNISNNHPNFS